MSHSTANGTSMLNTVITTPPATVPCIKVPWELACPNEAGKRPSSAKAAKSSGWGRKDTSTTKGSSSTSPTAVMKRAHCHPMSSKPCSNEVPDPSSSNRTSPLSAICASTESTVAPTNVPAMARGITWAGFSAFPARQQTSSNPMYPKNSKLVPDRVPPNPFGKNSSEDSSTLTCHAANPATIINTTSAHLATVKPLMTTLPSFRPTTHTSTHATCSSPAGTST
mmetsp:Transcript_21326/g.43670  ORF Transcript_21326/g.43670 Transcript_21326/m.43670 type:complete len:224 (-) Transcript_21326:1010-1681(-)